MTSMLNLAGLQPEWMMSRIGFPVRLTGLIMLLVHTTLKDKQKKAWKILFRDARKHPSPNSGWCEAASSIALLGVQLGGINTYKRVISNRALMGDPLVPLGQEDILRVNKILTITTLSFLLLLWMGGIVLEMAVTWI